MKPYKNLSGMSGIINFEIGEDYIIIEFKTGTHKFYKYTNGSCGENTIYKMKELAELGKGLNSFVSKNKPDFLEKY